MILNEPRLSINEAATRCGVHRDTITRWIDHGIDGRRLRQLRIGGRRFVLVRDLEAFLQHGSDEDDRDK